MVGILRPAIMGAIFLLDESRRLLAASIAAALLGVLLRSGMESAISLPAVAIAFAWVAGMSQSSGLE
jgi:EamA domain-containing membrane protein RarD